jgi:hypothetical protein
LDARFQIEDAADPQAFRDLEGNLAEMRLVNCLLEYPGRKVAPITQRGCCLPPPFIDVFDLLRGLVGLTSLVELKFQRL